jgi:uncharacterized membrane protein YeaQ/YmgE (transglycosylase-associated protein family)
VLFVCAIVLSVIAGIAYFAILRGGVGFFVCLLIVAAGIFGAFVYRYLMRGFGEIVEHQAEQTQLLLRMTEYLKTAVVDSGAAQTGTGKPYHTGAYQPPYQAPLSTDVVPSQAQTPTARFATRLMGDIACPVCGKRQMSSRNSCYACGCTFIYEDEQPPQS